MGHRYNEVFLLSLVCVEIIFSRSKKKKKKIVRKSPVRVELIVTLHSPFM
jgi:hypothetical protein